MIAPVEVTSSDIIALQALSRQTFFETFTRKNTPANMQEYRTRTNGITGRRWNKDRTDLRAERIPWAEGRSVNG